MLHIKGLRHQIYTFDVFETSQLVFGNEGVNNS